MHNQHARFSPTLADQHRTELQDQATHQRLLPAARQPRRSPQRWWQLRTRQSSPRAS
jgi:hypothetical protein